MEAVETASPSHQIAENEQRPPVGDRLCRHRDRAVLRVLQQPGTPLEPVRKPTALSRPRPFQVSGMSRECTIPLTAGVVVSMLTPGRAPSRRRAAPQSVAQHPHRIGALQRLDRRVLRIGRRTGTQHAAQRRPRLVQLAAAAWSRHASPPHTSWSSTDRKLQDRCTCPRTPVRGRLPRLRRELG
jgi:hypothetical protein